MEKKKEDQKLASTCNQASETNAASKQDHAQPDVTLGTTSTKTSNSSHDNAPSSNQQHPQNLQWSYTPENATEQFPAISIPSIATSSGVLNQWQQGQPFVPSTSPFWQPHSLGGNVPPNFQTMTPLGTTYAAWQAPPVMAEGFSSRSHPLIPNISYHVGYNFAGFSGAWDPSWLGQIHQLQYPYAYSFPGALGHSSATPRMPNCLDSGDHSFQRGIIRPPAKLSRKHQQLWESQSAENVQLWSVINNLQTEVGDYKDRLMKVTEEVSSLKRKVEEPNVEVVETVAVTRRQPSKRGRPKRSVTSVNRLCESIPGARGRKAALSKAQSEIKSPIFEKVVLNKAENKEKVRLSTSSMAQQENNEKITDVSGNFGIHQRNSMMSTDQAQVQQEYQGVQICSGTALNPSSGVKGNAEKEKDHKIAYSNLSQTDKVMNNSMDVSAKYIGSTGNGSVGWSSGIPSQASTRNVLDIPRQNFFHNGCFVQERGKISHGWSFANEEDGSEELEDAVVRSAKDEYKEEMGDENTSGAEEIDKSKDDGA